MVDDLHLMAAEVLGWRVESCRQFSLQTLREIVRATSPKLAREIDLVVLDGSYIVSAGAARVASGVAT